MSVVQKAKEEVNIKKQKEKQMKKINWKNVIEKAKTIVLIVIFTAAIAFYAGMKYQAGQDDHVSQKVDEAVKAVVSNQELKQ